MSKVSMTQTNKISQPISDLLHRLQLFQTRGEKRTKKDVRVKTDDIRARNKEKQSIRKREEGRRKRETGCL